MRQPEFDIEEYYEWLNMTNEEREKAGLLTTPEEEEIDGRSLEKS